VNSTREENSTHNCSTPLGVNMTECRAKHGQDGGHVMGRWYMEERIAAPHAADLS